MNDTTIKHGRDGNGTWSNIDSVVSRSITSDLSVMCLYIFYSNSTSVL